MLSLTLDCGRRVTLDAFDYSRTYAGLLEGRPNAEMNARIIERALAKGSWGQRKTHLIPPVIDERDPEHPVMPPACLRAWLWCNDPIDPAFQGPALVEAVEFPRHDRLEPMPLSVSILFGTEGG
jgi:hypothetical protein